MATDYYKVIAALKSIKLDLTNFELSVHDFWIQYGEILKKFGELNKQSSERLYTEKTVTNKYKEGVIDQIQIYQKELDRVISELYELIRKHK